MMYDVYVYLQGLRLKVFLDFPLDPAFVGNA